MASFELSGICVRTMPAQVRYRCGLKDSEVWEAPGWRPSQIESAPAVNGLGQNNEVRQV